ncbi:uncharacterized protein LOC116657657 [Camelus ferus]|uniref:Uncharacterized protein LOC116657657 n=1 Tax=Camelus ferus TaxID=419612 RepID=A0A8B8RG73_CAMFR|nr:uncharacterized protein LOC116657657 [Camelus ferus]
MSLLSPSQTISHPALSANRRAAHSPEPSARIRGLPRPHTVVPLRAKPGPLRAASATAERPPVGTCGGAGAWVALRSPGVAVIPASRGGSGCARLAAAAALRRSRRRRRRRRPGGLWRRGRERAATGTGRERAAGRGSRAALRAGLGGADGRATAAARLLAARLSQSPRKQVPVPHATSDLPLPSASATPSKRRRSRSICSFYFRCCLKAVRKPEALQPSSTLPEPSPAWLLISHAWMGLKGCNPFQCRRKQKLSINQFQV